MAAPLQQILVFLAVFAEGSCAPTCQSPGQPPGHFSLLQTGGQRRQTAEPLQASELAAAGAACWGEPDPEQQLHGEILQAICAKLHQASTNFLVFGLGRDSGFWYNNTVGKVLFLENHANWMKFQGDKVKTATRIVKYTTAAADYLNVLHDEAKLSEFLHSLPEEVRETHWDVILVDSPMGMEDLSGNPVPGVPGRMQSIYAAGQLAQTGTTIYVDDYHRHIEKASVEALLVPKQWRVANVHSSGHVAGTQVGQTAELLFGAPP